MSLQKKIYLFIITFSTTFIFSQSSKQSSPISPEEKEYLRNFIYPLQSYEPEIGFKEDSLVFNKFFSDSKFVGLGEASHGSAEIFKIKDKLTRYILKKNDGGVFAMETAMPNSKLVNEYIVKGNKSGREFVMNINSWIYMTEEILDMVEWMKIYNDRNERKVTFSGFDMTSYKSSISSLKFILDKYKLSDKDLITLLQRLNEKEKLMPKQVSEKTQADKDILGYIENLKVFSSKISDAEDKSWFVQNLTLLEQYNDKTYLNRNRFMAENILWLKDQYPESAFVIWAHNNHIKKEVRETGKFLEEKLKDEYINVGTFFFEGHNSVVGLNDREVKPVFIEKNSANSIEDILNSFEIPLFILDLKSIKKENNKLAKKLLNKIQYRTVGAAIHKKDHDSGNLSEDFDYIIFVKNSTASKLLSN